MASEVWKFPISITDEQLISMPRMANIIHVGLDPSGTPCIWAEVNTDDQVRPRAIAVVGTGRPIPEDAPIARHIGSFVQGRFVWHVYSRPALDVAWGKGGVT